MTRQAVNKPPVPPKPKDPIKPKVPNAPQPVQQKGYTSIPAVKKK